MTNGSASSASAGEHIPPLVGRRAEIDILRGIVAAPADNPKVVLITGEAGVGKSRLIREVVGRVRGVRVLHGHAHEADAVQPFQVVRDTFEQVAWQRMAVARGPWGHPLRHLLGQPMSRDEHDYGHSHQPDEPPRAGIQLVRALADEKALLVIFEDLHWADADSIAFFGKLATSRTPLVLIGTYRSEDIDSGHPLSLVLSVLSRQPSVIRLPLRGLSRDELRELLDSVYAKPVPRSVVDALHGRTLGHPYFIEQLIATAPSRRPEDLIDHPLPWTAAEAILRRLERLGEAERHVLEVVSVLGPRVPFDLLSAVCGLNEGPLIDVLRHLVAERLLVEIDPEVLAVQHALTREAAGGGLLGRQRKRLHQAALDALRARGSNDYALLGFHAEGAGRHAAAAEHYRAAADQMLHDGSQLQALRAATRGLALQRDDLPLTSLAARAAWAAGQLDDAERYAQRWRELAYEQGDLAEQSAALRQLATARWSAGDAAGHWRLINQAVAATEQLGPSEERGWALAYRAQAHLLNGQIDEAVAWSDEALASASAVGTDQVLAHVFITKGTALAEMPERRAEGLELLRAGRRRAERSGDLVALGRSLNNTVLALVTADASHEAWALLEEAEGVAEQYGLEVFGGLLGIISVQLAQMQGDAGTARQRLLAARKAATTTAQRIDVASLEAFQLLEDGNVDGAQAVIVSALDLAADMPPFWQLAELRGMAVATSRVLSSVRRLGPEWAPARGL